MRRVISTLSSAVASLLLMTGFAAALPYNLSTPSGLNPGDKFRFLAVTTGTTLPTSSDISFYNSFVQTDMGGATYGGNVVNWKAIGSTATVNARDNVGGFGTNVPVYKPRTGTKLADTLTTSAGGLWGAATQVLNAKPNETLTGTYEGYVYAGTESNGTKKSGPAGGLGEDGAYQGNSNAFWAAWLQGFPTSVPAPNLPMYALSEELTVGGGSPSGIPEIDPAGMASVLALVTGALGLLERRRSRR